MNIVKELHATAKKNYEQQMREINTVLESVKENLKMEDEKDKEILSFFGTEQVVANMESGKKALNHLYSGEFVTYDNVRKVCLDYNLRFLPTRYYKKEIPLKSLNEIRQYKEQNNIHPETMRDRLYIIAPASHFNLGARPSKDPVVLYEVDRRKYVVLSKWGNDFTFFRKISGFVARNPNILANLFIIVGWISLSILLTHLFNHGLPLVLNFFLILLIPLNNTIIDFVSLNDNWDRPTRSSKW